MRIGLVLGAGGVVGGSWLIGALEALEAETGWSPTTAEVISGTSAGSVIGALTASGISPSLMSAYSSGGALDDFDELEGREELVSERMSATGYRLHRALPPLGPGSWRMALGTLLHPTRHSPSALLSGWLPRGFISTRAISDLVERFVEGDWPQHPNYWAVACDYASGKRVPFGRAGSPPATVGQAVAASCAIPSFYHPVGIAGRRYIDGGVCSASNLDLMCERGLDLVVCLNPMSSLARMTARNGAERFAAAMRAQTGRRLGHEARKLRERGTDVLILQPTAEDLAVMGTNFMARDRQEAVIERAIRTTARQLRRGRNRPGFVVPRPPAKRRRTAARTAAATAKRAPAKRPTPAKRAA
jgi:NTE family protein